MAEQSGENANPVKEVFEELFSLLENLETQNAAVVAFLKDQGIATEEKLTPYLDQAGNAASVRWRAARVRMDHLFSPIPAAVLDREPAKATPKEQDSPNKPTEAQEKSDTSEAKQPEEKSTKPKAESSAPPSGKNGSTKDQSANQQPAEPQNSDQPQAAKPQTSSQSQAEDAKDSKSTGTENKKTASATASASSSTAPPPRGPVGPGAVAQEKKDPAEVAPNNQPAK